MIEELAFAAISAIIVASAVMVVKASDMVHAALYLALAFVAIAALFLTLEAEFLAVVQVLIYAGAVVVLMLFAIMLTKRTEAAPK